MPRLAEKMVRKWRTNTAGKGSVWADEVQAVDVNPFELAAAQNAVRMAKLQETKDLWEQIMRTIRPDVWKKVCAALPDNYNRSVEVKAFKQERFARAFAPVLEEAKRIAAAMPGTTLAERLRRVEAVVKLLVQNKAKWRVAR